MLKALDHRRSVVPFVSLLSAARCFRGALGARACLADINRGLGDSALSVEIGDSLSQVLYKTVASFDVLYDQ